MRSWEEFADLVRRRRLTLDLTQREVAELGGIVPVTVNRIEQAHPVKRRTLWKIDKALGWKPGSSEEFLSTGAEPVVVPGPDELFTDPAEAAIMGITDLPEKRRREWVGVLRRHRADSLRPDQDTA